MTAASQRLVKNQARVDRLFKQHCANILMPVLAVSAVYSKGMLLAILGKGDEEIAQAMRQEALDAGQHVVQVQP